MSDVLEVKKPLEEEKTHAPLQQDVSVSKDATKTQSEHDLSEPLEKERTKEPTEEELEREKQSLLRTRAEELTRNDESVVIKIGTPTEKQYIPKNILGKIQSFTDYEQNRIEGVSKMKAFFGRTVCTPFWAINFSILPLPPLGLKETSTVLGVSAV